MILISQDRRLTKAAREALEADNTAQRLNLIRQKVFIRYAAADADALAAKPEDILTYLHQH